ncbi:hypothetical protein DMC63_01165 [Streptomyces sp. WAC 05977]|nr:hypothetical protein DMC63_01165 [Streptomyces sp. WAC 05977]
MRLGGDELGCPVEREVQTGREDLETAPTAGVEWRRAVEQQLGQSEREPRVGRGEQLVGQPADAPAFGVAGVAGGLDAAGRVRGAVGGADGHRSHPLRE